MINSGWMLPDFYEIKCKSCSTLNGHIEVVKRYLEALRRQDSYLYEKIMLSFKQESDKLPYLGLDDFAVMKLGWIKINDSPTNIIFYSDNCELDLAVKKYLNLGFYPVVLNGCGKIISIDIPSLKLLKPR